MAFDQPSELFESPLHHLRTCAEARESGTSGGNGIAVAVEAEQLHVGSSVEQSGRVACATNRAVDDQSGRHR
jgi:hypothetical protein